MNRYINDFYTKVDIDADAVDRIIAASKTAKPRKTVSKIIIPVSTCAAVLVILALPALIFQTTTVTIDKNNDMFTYSNIEKFESVTTAADDVLYSHGGIALWIEGAYFNGHKMYVAVKGECIEYDWADSSLPDILRFTDFSDEQTIFSINDIPVTPVGDEIVLTKNRKYYEGVVQFNFENEESLVFLKMNLPMIDAYSGGTFTKTVSGPFEMSDVISRTYTVDEERVLNSNDEMYIRSVAAYPHRALNEPEMGLLMDYYIPDEIYASGIRINAKIYNEDGTEVALIQEFQSRAESGFIKCAGYDYPAGRNVKVVLTDAVSSDVLQEYEVYLNDPEIEFVLDD
ncbi:MAG: hypothetical protein IJH32_04740 [Ruminococcus sp.]|nr:hypothetical protein [Ruminococcus sp.]